MTDLNETILLIEDDERLARLTARYLAGYGVQVIIRCDGVEGEAEGKRGAYDCVIVDVQLPRRSGIEVCRALRRASAVAIVLVSAYSDEDTRVRGLEAGADDFLTKPFSPRELLARIRANVRRVRGDVGPSIRPIHAGRLTLDPQGLTVSLDDRPIAVTPREFAVLRVLAENAGAAVSRDRLLELSMGSAELAFERAIDCLVSRLRSKLGDDGRAPQLLKTVRGGGYMWIASGHGK
jgi:DNA-binding response OmpR family regulator